VSCIPCLSLLDTLNCLVRPALQPPTNIPDCANPTWLLKPKLLELICGFHNLWQRMPVDVRINFRRWALFSNIGFFLIANDRAFPANNCPWFFSHDEGLLTTIWLGHPNRRIASPMARWICANGLLGSEAVERSFVLIPTK
jgi:hypothetical protein